MFPFEKFIASKVFKNNDEDNIKMNFKDVMCADEDLGQLGQVIGFLKAVMKTSCFCMTWIFFLA